MNTFTYTKNTDRSNAVISVPGLLAGILLSFLIGSFLLAVISTISSANRVIKGIAVNGLDLSGLTLDEATVAISSQMQYTNTGRIVMVYKEQSWLATPSELGLFLDARASAQNALDTGRGFNPVSNTIQKIKSRLNGYNLPPAMVFDEKTTQQYLLKISEQINRPVVEAGISIQDLEVTTQTGQVGLELDVDSTLKVLSVQLQTLQDGVVPLIVKETPPVLVDAAPLAESARKIISAPLVLTVPDAAQTGLGPWTIDQAAIARVLTVTPDPDNPAYPYKVGLDRNAMRGYLEGIAPALERSPANARFIFNDDTLQLDLKEPAIAGSSLSIEESLQDINTQLAAGQHTIPLKLVYIQPDVPDSATGQELGITELIHSESSYFYGSSADRISNIRTAAENFHGLLIAPGENFSMAESMKDVTLDNGYTEALIIFGNQTIKGVGGGVCQVSTTLFRAAFFSGFPITERYAHAYRVGYYEQTSSGASDSNLAGLDATVFIPVVDLKFTNDTPYWLLMETYVTDSRITWKFYSTSDGRSMEWKNGGLQNVVEAPKPVYKENPQLPEGKIKQVDWSADGADIVVSRIVYKDGQIYFQDAFNTHYAPWQAVYEFGPGTKLPKKAQIAEP